MSRKKASSYETEQLPFPTRLRQLMQESGTTQKALAEAIGVQPQTVSYYAVGQSSPNADTLVRIADFFHVTADYLLSRPNAPKVYDDDVSRAASTLGISDKAAGRILGMARGPSPLIFFPLSRFLESDEFRRIAESLHNFAAKRPNPQRGTHNISFDLGIPPARDLYKLQAIYSLMGLFEKIEAAERAEDPNAGQ